MQPHKHFMVTNTALENYGVALLEAPGGNSTA